MPEEIKWGIIGLGHIAHSFAQAFKYAENARLIAVASRSTEKAKAFAQKYNVPKAFGTYEALMRCQDIQVVYIATPHGRHYEDMALCLEHGKAILCEKSFTLNAAQAKTIFEKAMRKKIFVMEAMWTRFLPLMQKLKELVATHEIGYLRLFSADLGFNFPFDPQSRLFNPQLGGGALLDVGVYPISLSQWILGLPTLISSQVVMGKTGVDEQAVMAFKYDDGVLASLFTSIRSVTPSRGVIMGTEGVIEIHGPLYRPVALTVRKTDKSPETIEVPLTGNGYNYEIEEVNQCLRAGRTESLWMPWADTIAVMEIMDRLRKQWGMRYPQEL